MEHDHDHRLHSVCWDDGASYTQPVEVVHWCRTHDFHCHSYGYFDVGGYRNERSCNAIDPRQAPLAWKAETWWEKKKKQQQQQQRA